MEIRWRAGEISALAVAMRRNLYCSVGAAAMRYTVLLLLYTIYTFTVA
jgi:hypothetical protein